MTVLITLCKVLGVVQNSEHQHIGGLESSTCIHLRYRKAHGGLFLIYTTGYHIIILMS
jgi:hypothetical protein